MPQAQVEMTVRRTSANVAIIDVKGELTAFAEGVLTEAYNQARVGDTRVIILNLRGVNFIASNGLGLLVTFLIRLNREKQRLLICCLSSEHHKYIFKVTSLDEATGAYDTEEEAIQVANAG